LNIPLIVYTSIIAFITSLLLLVYILKKNPKSRINQIWALFLVMTMLITLGEAILKIIGDDKEAALFWFRLLVMPGGGFLAPIFLHFTLIFTKQDKILKNRILLIVIYLPILILYIRGLMINVPLDDLKISSLGYYTTQSLLTIVAGSLIYPINMGIIGGLILLGVNVLINGYRKTKIEIEKNQIKYILAGSFLLLGLNFIVYVLLPPDIAQNFSEATSITAVLMAGIIAYAIVKYKLMAEVKLVTEEIPTKPIDYEIESGFTYIIPEREPKTGFQLFAKTMAEGVHGICITLRNPTIIRKKYGLKKTPIIWITKEETNELSVKPSEIARINEILKPFLEKSEDSVILLIDDKSITGGLKIEDHSKILEISRNFFNTVVTANSRFIISVAPTSISPKKRKPIIKTKTPLLEFNRLAAFVFEDICNNVIKFLIRNGYIKNEDVPRHISNLSRKDDFFKILKYPISKNPSGGNSKIKFSNILVAQKITKTVLVDKLKLFISEFENIETAMNLDAIAMGAIGKYGLSKNEFLLHVGDSYIIKESIPIKSIEIFSEFVSKDFMGLGIFKTNPEKVIRKYALPKKGIKYYWLTDISESKQNVLPPKLEHILSAIEDFLGNESFKNKNKIILLDGVEYLITYSGDNFDSVLGFLRQVTDLISEANALIMIPLNPKIIDEERIGLLMRSGMELYEGDNSEFYIK
jgi:hypothetical protein